MIIIIFAIGLRSRLRCILRLWGCLRLRWRFLLCLWGKVSVPGLSELVDLVSFSDCFSDPDGPRGYPIREQLVRKLGGCDRLLHPSPAQPRPILDVIKSGQQLLGRQAIFAVADEHRTDVPEEPVWRGSDQVGVFERG